MRRRRPDAVRLGTLFLLLVGFLAMHAMGSSTAGVGHHTSATLAFAQLHPVDPHGMHPLPAAPNDSMAATDPGVEPTLVAGVNGVSDDALTTTGCVIALTGLLGLLALLARLRGGDGVRGRTPAARPRLAAVGITESPRPKSRLHISLCVLRT